MERVSTEELRRAGKAAAWNEIYSGMLAAADFIPGEADFSAGLMLSHVGRLGLARLATGRCKIRRTAAHIDLSSPQLYSFIIQANGKGSFSQSGNRAVLSRGDFTLCDHSLPHSRNIDSGAEMLLIRVPAEMIAQYLPCPDLLCGRRLPAGAGLTPSAVAMIRSLWRDLERGFSSPYEDCLAHHVLEVIATSYAMVFGSIVNGEGPSGGDLLAAQQFVEDNLHDPDFKPGAIAPALGMAASELGSLFESLGESPRSYLLRRRLEEAARRLRDLRWRGHTIAEVAHCCGFVSTAAFARSFRDAFGLTPTEYRQATRSAVS